MKSNLKELRAITAFLSFPVGYAIGQAIAAQFRAPESFGSLALFVFGTWAVGYAIAYLGLGAIASFFYRRK